ncbi:MAG: hypothetical protein ACK5LP_10575 [Campylobacteraceae bacterium]
MQFLGDLNFECYLGYKEDYLLSSERIIEDCKKMRNLNVKDKETILFLTIKILTNDNNIQIQYLEFLYSFASLLNIPHEFLGKNLNNLHGKIKIVR